jgi:hypothetical protein
MSWEDIMRRVLPPTAASKEVSRVTVIGRELCYDR